MATQRVLPQSKETLLQNYNKRLKDDIRSILDNFTEIIKTAKVRRFGSSSFSVVFVFVFARIFTCDKNSENVEHCSHFFSLQIEDETQVSRATQAEQDHYEMHVRAANIVSLCTVQTE